MTLWLIEVAMDVTERTCFFQHFFCLCTRKVPFELKLQLELAVCDSDIWFMFFPMPLLGSVISFLLQKHSSWEFPLAFFLIPCISQAPPSPSSFQICYTVYIGPPVYHECVCFYTFTWRMFHSLSPSTNLEDTNPIYWYSYLGSPVLSVYSCITHRILIRINALWFLFNYSWPSN